MNFKTLRGELQGTPLKFADCFLPDKNVLDRTLQRENMTVRLRPYTFFDEEQRLTDSDVAKCCFLNEWKCLINLLI